MNSNLSPQHSSNMSFSIENLKNVIKVNNEGEKKKMTNPKFKNTTMISTLSKAMFLLLGGSFIPILGALLNLVIRNNLKSYYSYYFLIINQWYE